MYVCVCLWDAGGWLLPPCIRFHWGWVKQTLWSSPPSGHSGPLWFPFLPWSPSWWFWQAALTPSPSLLPRSTPPKATAGSRAGVEAPEPRSVLAGPWAPDRLAPPAGDLCNTFPGLHFPADWKQSHCWFSPKKIYLEVQLPWITWWRERPDLAVNNFPLSHTGAWLAAESKLQMMVLDGEGEREAKRKCVRERARVHTLGALAQLLPLLSSLEFCVCMSGEGRDGGRTGAGLLGSFLSWFIGPPAWSPTQES